MTLIYLFFTFSCFAQISINNSDYIYVDSLFLYTDASIDLKTIESHIYLRNNAQLLQGGLGALENTGLGSLSVYQSGNVNEYAYNYWCSPVGTNAVNNSTNNSFALNLIGDPDTAINNTAYVSANFSTSNSGTTNPLVISDRWLYTFELGANASFNWNYIGSSGIISPGLGFTMKGTTNSNNAQRYEFRGKPNSSTISNTVAAGEVVLVGNPYPSGFDILKFIHDSDNIDAIDGTLFFWEQDLNILSHYTKDYQGGYATYTVTSDGLLETFVPAPFSTYNNDGTMNSTGYGVGSKTVSRYLSIGQGFMVVGKADTSGVVQTKNSYRVFSNTAQIPNEFYKTLENKKQVATTYRQFRLNIDFESLYTRQLVYNFNEYASDNFDYGLEIKKFSVLPNDAYWTQNDELYVAKAAIFSENLSIPIVLDLSTGATLNFRLFDVQNFDEQQAIYLFDTIETISYNLTAQDVLLNLSAGKYTDRFKIIFQSKKLSILDENSSTAGFSIFYEKENAKIKIINRKAILLYSAALYNASGMQVFHKLIKKDDLIILVSVNNLAPGVYFLKCAMGKLIKNFKFIVY